MVQEDGVTEEETRFREFVGAIEVDGPDWYLFDVLIRATTRSNIEQLVGLIPPNRLLRLRTYVFRHELAYWIGAPEAGGKARRCLPAEDALPIVYLALRKD